ncbi:MAG: thymidylate synthase [Candidatus Omnitrophota bacterium]|jgi:thymidylate synthase
MGREGIPVILVQRETLPEAWEEAVIRTWEEGVSVRTEYDKPQDPPSRDCTMVMVVKDPFKEPRIHRAFPGGLDSLEVYRQEVVYGIHDHWIAPEEGKWTYTYHQRLFSYKSESGFIDQMDYVIEKLSNSGHSRRAQAITWDPELDVLTDDPPCLQRVWFRISEDNAMPVLNMNTHWRSRDGFKAAFMNMFALTDLQRIIAGKISAKTGRIIGVGRYADMTDSFHIYGSYYSNFEGFLELTRKRDFSQRVWDSSFAAPFFDEARAKIKRERGMP